MENKPVIVALDQGTSGVRAFAVSLDGAVLCQKSQPLAPSRPAEGLSEYDAHTLAQTQIRVLNELLDEVGPHNVLSLAVTSQRSTVVLWDKQTAQPLAPVLTWEDGRAFAQAEQAAISQEEVHRLTGLYKTPYFSAPKIAWCLQNIPAVSQAARNGTLLAAPVASYLIWHLTQGKTFATDVTLAQRMLLLDIHTKQWNPSLCQTFQVSPSILPEIKPSVGDYGVYEYGGGSLPIRVCVGDQQASVAFMDILPGQACINYGTGAFFLYNAGVEKAALLPGMLTSLSAFDENGACNFLLEGPVNAAGSALQWLQAQGMSFSVQEAEALCRTSRKPVWFLPALGGLGAPYWDFALSPVAAGLSPRTQKADWVAGVLRSIACLIADMAAYLRVNGFEVKGAVKVSGGLSRISWLLEQQANLLHTPLLPLHEAESTVLGAARLAAGKEGSFKAFLQGKETPLTRPQVSAEKSASLYRKWVSFVDWCKKFPGA